MSRRVKLPGASELFRSTGIEVPESNAGTGSRPSEPVRSVESAPSAPAVPAPTASDPVQTVPSVQAEQRVADQRSVGAPTVGTGRVRHDEKITVYVSREELLALEQARLRLRGELGLAVDRGRLVRAAIAQALADLDVAGESSELVRRLTAS